MPHFGSSHVNSISKLEKAQRDFTIQKNLQKEVFVHENFW